MKLLYFTSAIALITVWLSFSMKQDSKEMSKNIYDYEIVSIDGDTMSMSQFKGKKLLLVNVASECGFTPQYEDLQKLHDAYKDKVTLIGFPCNQFGGQEPGSEAQIKAFCKKNYGVEFLITSKIDVKGDNQHPIYSWLTQRELNGVKNSSVKWNFQKYLIDENGKFVDVYGSVTKPLAKDITQHLN